MKSLPPHTPEIIKALLSYIITNKILIDTSNLQEIRKLLLAADCYLISALRLAVNRIYPFGTTPEQLLDSLFFSCNSKFQDHIPNRDLRTGLIKHVQNIGIKFQELGDLYNNQTIKIPFFDFWTQINEKKKDFSQTDDESPLLQFFIDSRENSINLWSDKSQ